MKGKRFEQLETVLIALILPFVILFAVQLIKSEFTSTQFYLYFSILLILLLCLLCFYKIAITIDNTYISKN